MLNVATGIVVSHIHLGFLNMVNVPYWYTTMQWGLSLSEDTFVFTILNTYLDIFLTFRNKI